MQINKKDIEKLKGNYSKEKREEKKTQRLLYANMIVISVVTILLITFIHKGVMYTIDRIDTTSRSVQTQIAYIESNQEYEKIDGMEEDRHERLLDCIGFLESTNKNTVILDSNNKYSYGEYQLQRETIQDFYKRYKGIEITLQEAEEIAMNSIQSRELAKEMIIEYGLIGKWHTTVGKIANGKCANFEADEINNYIN